MHGEQIITRYIIRDYLRRGVVAVAVLSAAALGGCAPAFADRWQPPSDIHAAVYRRDTTGLKKAIAAHPESVNLESFYSVDPYWVYGYALPLSLAVRREWKEGVVILLANGADAGKSESSGSSPMRRAIARRDAASVRLF